jgi:ABC-type phosphate transport system substrate-binding protein
MRFFKTILLAGASALLAATVLSAPAFAATINGAGSSLIGPYWAQILSCHAQNVILDNGSFNTCPTPPPPWDDTVNTFKYLISSSGNGIKGFYSADPSNWTYPTGVSIYSSVTYALSDAALSPDDVATYKDGSAAHGNHQVQGLTILAPGDLTTPINATVVRNPGNNNDALIQIPLSIDPVAIAWNANDGFTTNTSDSNVHLDRAAYCKIFNHIITDWNDATLTTLNGGTSLTGGTSLPIVLVGRSDNSGTTAIFTRHLMTVCSGMSGNQFTSENLTASNFQQIPSTLQSFYSLQAGSGGVANTIGTTAGALGYIGADYTFDFVGNTNATLQVLISAALQVGSSSNFATPATTNAILDAFGAVLPPQTTVNGMGNAVYSPGTTANGLRTDPGAWVPLIPNPSVGYPIIGTTNGLLYTRYCTSSGAANALVAPMGPEGILHWYYDATNTVPDIILGNDGLARLPKVWNQAIFDTFITSPVRIRSSVC